MRYRAFVFEPDKSVRRLLVELLQRRGYEVHAWATARPCETCEDGPCADVVLVDVGLNVGAGAPFVAAQVAAGCNGAAMALMGASWVAEDRATAAQVGCPMFAKPFRWRKFERWLERVERAIPPDRVLGRGFLARLGPPEPVPRVQDGAA